MTYGISWITVEMMLADQAYFESDEDKKNKKVIARTPEEQERELERMGL